MLITEAYIVRTSDIEKVISSIKKLPWDKMDPHLLVWTFYKTGKEYADTLRVVSKTYPNNNLIKGLVEEELDTDNLNYGGYKNRADHFKFLEHFFDREKLKGIPDALHLAIDRAERSIELSSDYERSMTLFIRESSALGILGLVKNVHDWENLGLGYFKYYINRHLELDEASGGYGNLAENFQINDHIALKFYQERFDIFKNCIK